MKFGFFVDIKKKEILHQSILYLVNNPMDAHWVKLRLMAHDAVDGYLILTAAGLTYCEKDVEKSVEKSELVGLFDGIKQGWARPASPQEFQYIQDREPLLMKNLIIVKANSLHDVALSTNSTELQRRYSI
jgi:hypothetical protein